MDKKGSRRNTSDVPSAETGPIIEIRASRLRAARRDPGLRKFLADAMAQEKRLEREGLIHRPNGQ